MRARLTALLLALAAAAALLVGTQAPAQAADAACGTGYNQQWHHAFSNHDLVLSRKGTSNSWCALLNATNELYGVPHYMGVTISADQPVSCSSSDGDGGTFSYYAGPVKIGCGSAGSIRMFYQWTSPGGTHYSGTFLA